MSYTAAELERLEDAQVPPVDEKKKKIRIPTDDELAQRWLDAHPLTAYGLGNWRRYKDGAWPIVSDNDVNREIRDVLIAAKREGVRPSQYVLASVEKLARIPVAVDNELWDTDNDILVCRNGTLRISTREILPHDPMYYVTESLPYDYDPSAEAPVWDYVIKSTIPDIEEFLQEFAGYCLTSDTSYELAVWLYGAPGGGRSTIIGGLDAMLGNRAGLLGLAAIERSRFSLNNLPGKTLVTATEQPSMFLKSTDVLNAIISGEPVTIERKFRDQYEIIPHTKVLWAMNELPRISDPNNGIWRRVTIVEFPPREEAQRDPTIKGRVREEASGILNWALLGLDRLRQRGRFEIPQSARKATEEFKDTNDIPKMFIEEKCLRGIDYTTQSENLYSAYKSWCYVTDHKPLSSTSIVTEWKRLGLRKYESNGRKFWEGVGLIQGET